MQNVSIPLFVSSDSSLGAFNVSPGKDRFDIQFKNTIEIPNDAKNMTLELTQATVFWTVLNIKAGINDAFRLLVSGDPGSPYNITIPPGLYAPVDLNEAVNRELVNAGLTSGLVIITGDNSTGRILLTLTDALLRVEWVPSSFFTLVGWNSGDFVPSGGFTAAAFSELSPNIAAFSDVSSFLIHTNLVQSGIPIGNLEAQVLASVQINVPPGSQINYNPFNPIKLSVNHLIGQNINEATFYITD